MELDQQTRQKIEQLTSHDVFTFARASNLRELSPGALAVAAQLASRYGGSLLAIQYLRHMSRCTLRDAIDFLNDL